MVRAIVLSCLAAIGCGDGDAAVCVPGQSIACVGPGGCAGGQVCAEDGVRYGRCECARTDGGADDGGVAGDASRDAGDGGPDLTCGGGPACASGEFCSPDGACEECMLEEAPCAPLGPDAGIPFGGIGLERGVNYHGYLCSPGGISTWCFTLDGTVGRDFRARVALACHEAPVNLQLYRRDWGSAQLLATSERCASDGGDCLSCRLTAPGTYELAVRGPGRLAYLLTASW